MSSEHDAHETHDTEDTKQTRTTDSTASPQAPVDEHFQPTASPRPRRAVLMLTGVALLGVLAGGGVGYAVGHGSDPSSTDAPSGSSSALTLPTTLPGGYQRSTQVDKNIKSSVESARTTLGAGTDMALYTKDKDQVLVEATRLPGDALLQAGMTYAKNGDLVCATTSSTSGSEAICSRSTDALTVNVTATTADIASKYADEVFTSLA